MSKGRQSDPLAFLRERAAIVTARELLPDEVPLYAYYVEAVLKPGNAIVPTVITKAEYADRISLPPGRYMLVGALVKIEE